MKFEFSFYYNFIIWSSFVALYLSLSACHDKILEIRPADPTLYKNQTIQFRVVLIDSKGETDVTGSTTWESSDIHVASIDMQGKALALGEGKTIITATYLTLTQKTQLSVVAPKCISDLSDWKLRYTPNSDCASCHTICVNFFHCLDLGNIWRTTNCQNCHIIDSHSKYGL